MSATIDDEDEFTDPVTAPDDGDDANGATFQDPAQDLANRTRYLKNRTDALYGNDPVALEGTLTLEDEDVEIEEDLTVGGSLSVTNATVVGDVAIGDDLDVGGDITVERVTADSYLKGRIRYSTGAGADADSTLTVGVTAQIISVASLAANRSYTISDTDAEDGDSFSIRNGDATYTIALKNPSAATIYQIDPGEAVTVIRIAGSWRIFWDFPAVDGYT